MIWFGDTLRVLAASQLLIVGLHFLLRHRDMLGRLVSLLAFCLIALVIADHGKLVGNPVTTYLLFRFGILTPFILYVIAFHLFVDIGKIHPLHWAAAGFYFLARSLGSPFYDPAMPYGSTFFVLIYVIPQTLILYFSALAVFTAARDYRSDLMEERRRFRLLFIVSTGVLLSFRTINGFLTFADPFLDRFYLFSLPPIPDFVFAAYVFCLVLAFNLTVFRTQNDAVKLMTTAAQNLPEPIKPTDYKPKTRDANVALISSIATRMEKDRLYTRSGFTIAALAKELSTQEYRLRKVINKELQYRNFNQFLNHYRIAEASKRLLESTTPISSIALDIGYGSLSSFNTAFKAQFGVTPTEYRSAGNPGQ
ncbi:MAG: helix-turn-helix transcriptional regulator [Pseudohongiellaceae bacterium]